MKFVTLRAYVWRKKPAPWANLSALKLIETANPLLRQLLQSSECSTKTLCASRLISEVNPRSRSFDLSLSVLNPQDKRQSAQDSSWVAE